MSEKIHGDIESEEVPEVMSFDDGLRAAISRIEELLQTQDFVAVGVEGSGCGVGKSTLTGSICAEFRCRDIPVVTSGTGDHNLLMSLYSLACEKSRLQCLKSLLIVEGMGLESAVPRTRKKEIRGKFNEVFQAKFREWEIPHDRLDLLISIYTPDRPFINAGEDACPLGDVVICNEKARRD